MYTEADLKQLPDGSIHDFIRSKPSMYLAGQETPNFPVLISAVMYDAIALGSKKIYSEVESAWALIFSETNWLILGRERITIDDIFFQMYSLPGTGNLGPRYEVVVAAFAESLLYFDGSSSDGLLIKGERPSRYNFPDICSELRYGIAFSLGGDLQIS